MSEITPCAASCGKPACQVLGCVRVYAFEHALEVMRPTRPTTRDWHAREDALLQVIYDATDAESGAVTAEDVRTLLAGQLDGFFARFGPLV